MTTMLSIVQEKNNEISKTLSIKKFKLIAGVDESGCGSLVGSVIAAAVILHPIQPISGLADSKTLNKNKRLNLYKNIIKNALTWSIGYADVTEIDRFNILEARLLAMKRAVHNLSIKPDLILIDGNRSPGFTEIPYQCFKKGDARIEVISAASIIAKVTRDQDMIILDGQYPKYGFAQNKGYPTSFHLKQLALYGPISHHRKSFAPVKHVISDINRKLYV
ncbi:ribonuclease HII [Blochmannia endosymbiont of Camponotus modoc]|uniref:ribonuclease HII n=1 Tax=Blochmannia endosymbiont of Camponotus modoc TaxID=2945587 RepID=UPI00202533FA|nr:ribonuclease HII [Blochmannia endosymbiont of Camponotus modoc]URJ26488.1 ribonuclease HII [Blochmannia endosymbiont of Camponotus modoc]